MSNTQEVLQYLKDAKSYLAELVFSLKKFGAREGDGTQQYYNDNFHTCLYEAVEYLADKPKEVFYQLIKDEFLYKTLEQQEISKYKLMEYFITHYQQNIFEENEKIIVLNTLKHWEA